MASITALDLVNRVLTFHRFNDVTDFSDVKSRAALLVINQAIDKVLNSNDWEFARRHDGVLETTAIVNPDGGGPSTMSMTSSSNLFVSISDPGFTMESPVIRYVNLGGSTTDPGQNGISYPVVRYYSNVGSNYLVELASSWLGTTAQTDNYVFYSAEYTLPSHVRGMVSATKQDSGRLDVEMVSPELRLEELTTEPYGNVSDDTRTIYQGGTAKATYAGATGENEYGPRIIVWPIPETRFKIDYSYWYRFPQMSLPTDQISSVSDSVIHDVVNWAYAHSNLTGIGNDPKLGTALKADTRYEINETRSSEKATKSYDGRIIPFGSIGRRGSRNPRDRWDSQTIVEP